MCAQAFGYKSRGLRRRLRAEAPPPLELSQVPHDQRSSSAREALGQPTSLALDTKRLDQIGHASGIALHQAPEPIRTAISRRRDL